MMNSKESLTPKDYEELITTALLHFGDFDGTYQKDIWKWVHGNAPYSVEKDFLHSLIRISTDKGGRQKPAV